MRLSSLNYTSGLILILLQLAACGDNSDRIKPSRTTITESVYSSVTVQPDSLYQVFAAVSGILDQNLVEEGDPVKKGTPVAQIINNTPKLNVENARLNLELARDNYRGNNAILRVMEQEIQTARLQLQNDSANYFRQKNLWDQNIGSEIEYDNRKLAYELSRNKLELIESDYSRMKNELKTRYIQAENDYKTAMINTGDFRVESKINGTVYALYKKHGESISSLEPLANIGSSDVFVVEMLVDEVDIVKIAAGQLAIITLDAYEGRIFEAEVSKIYPRKDQRSQTFKVEALFRAPPDVLYPGLAGEGNIVVGNREDVLTIPKEYVVGQDQVLTEDGLITVELGLQNLDLVEIRSGLEEDTYILMPE